jgi:hypothetical protein
MSVWLHLAVDNKADAKILFQTIMPVITKTGLSVMVRYKGLYVEIKNGMDPQRLANAVKRALQDGTRGSEVDYDNEPIPPST